MIKKFLSNLLLLVVCVFIAMMINATITTNMVATVVLGLIALFALNGIVNRIRK